MRCSSNLPSFPSTLRPQALPITEVAYQVIFPALASFMSTKLVWCRVVLTRKKWEQMLANTCDGTTLCGVKAACEIKAVTESEPRYLPPSQERALRQRASAWTTLRRKSALASRLPICHFQLPSQCVLEGSLSTLLRSEFKLKGDKKSLQIWSTGTP